MAELVSSSETRTPRDSSPDSLFFPPDHSNFSLFSSTSASADRSSFASDNHDHDSLFSELSQHLAGHSKNSGVAGLTYKEEKAIAVLKEENEAEEENFALDSARNSFSVALKECQVRKSRSDVFLKKADRQRPASLDFNNNVMAISPRFGAMRKSSVPSRRSGTFPSPGTPNYRHTGVGIQKGWCSERVPLPYNSNRRQMGTPLVPFNNSGRTLPSKWEDAERWIFSPVSGDGFLRPSVPAPQRRPKSKSGPLGPPGVAYYSLYSPAMPVYEGRNVGNLMAGSPFSAGVIVADRTAIQSTGHGGSFPSNSEHYMARSASVHGCSELLSMSSLPGTQESDDKVDGARDASIDAFRAVSRRDMATQMSPESSVHSSPRRRPSSAMSIVESQNVSSSKTEVRDVEVDERVTMIRWSKKHRARQSGTGSESMDDWAKKALDTQCSWEISETAKRASKAKREEARITAWENLQKAKAEAAIRKLEMTLEKKRSSSMDRIMNKLRSAHKKAQEMRSSVLASEAHKVTRTSHKKTLSFRKPRQRSSLSGCFTCRVF